MGLTEYLNISIEKKVEIFAKINITCSLRYLLIIKKLNFNDKIYISVKYILLIAKNKVDSLFTKNITFYFVVFK